MQMPLQTRRLFYHKQAPIREMLLALSSKNFKVRKKSLLNYHLMSRVKNSLFNLSHRILCTASHLMCKTKLLPMTSSQDLISNNSQIIFKTIKTSLLKFNQILSSSTSKLIQHKHNHHFSNSLK